MGWPGGPRGIKTGWRTRLWPYNLPGSIFKYLVAKSAELMFIQRKSRRPRQAATAPSELSRFVPMVPLGWLAPPALRHALSCFLSACQAILCVKRTRCIRDGIIPLPCPRVKPHDPPAKKNKHFFGVIFCSGCSGSVARNSNGTQTPVYTSKKSFGIRVERTTANIVSFHSNLSHRSNEVKTRPSPAPLPHNITICRLYSKQQYE